MKDTQTTLRNIPQVEKVLQIKAVKDCIPHIGHGSVVKIIREETSLFREKIKQGESLLEKDLIAQIEGHCKAKKKEKLQRVINGTGVVIHTNLGRSPLGPELTGKLMQALSGYCNLEFHLLSEKRGSRGGFAEELICELTGAESTLIVNNNASAVFLILTCFAHGREVIVSRSELIQIGGGFRIPDIMEQTGARLVEVGTTNITTIDDFKKAVTPDTAMILSAHQSNYRIEGFTEAPSLKEMSSLKSDSILFVRDLGSGNLMNDQQLPQPFEPTVSSELSQGIDLVCFSGDKLLGGPQSGIIVGKKELIDQLRKHPLMRMIRVDKITYYLLQETLLNYMNNSSHDILLWKTIMQRAADVKKRVNRFMKKLKTPDARSCIQGIHTQSTFGGGAMPTVEMDSYGIRISFSGARADEIYSFFINEEIPVVGKVLNDAYILDFRTILDNDLEYLARAVDRCINNFNG